MRAGSLIRDIVLAALFLAFAAGCGQRLRYQDSIQVPLTLAGARARSDLLARISPALLQELGGTLPDPWPESAPRLTEDLILQVSVPLLQADLGKVGEDLAGVRLGDAETRLRRVEFIYENRTLTHPLLTGEVWTLPKEGDPSGNLQAHRVGTLEGLEAGTGQMVFQPGGRFALTEALIQEVSTLDLQLRMAFDTGRDRALPGGEAFLQLTIYVDVLR